MRDVKPHFRIGNGNYARSVLLISLAAAPMIAIGSVLGPQTLDKLRQSSFLPEGLSE